MNRLTRRQRVRPGRGFTLIEMTLVALIILILASMALASMQRARGQALETAAQKALKSIDEAQELYYQRNGVYADEFNQLVDTFLPQSYNTGDQVGIFAQNYSLIFISPGEIFPPWTSATGSFSTFSNFTVVAVPFDPTLRTFITDYEGRVRVF